jgi:large subunit ribosomal protein L21
MYAVIRSGGKQQKVAQGQRLEVEKLGKEAGASVSFQPLLLVDGQEVLSGPGRLAGAEVTAVVVGETKGPKIDAFTYKAKANVRRRWGHRQKYTTIEITGISRP